MSETKDIPSIPFCMLGTSIPKVGRKLLRFPPTRCVFSNMKKPELRLMRGSGFRYGQRTSNQGSGRVRQDSGCAEYEESADSNPCCHTR